MIGYIMFGTNDLKKSIKFYDSFLNKLDLVKTDYQKEFVGYANKYDQENIIFYITKPFDGGQASFVNGTMLAFKAFSPEIVVFKCTIFLIFYPFRSNTLGHLQEHHQHHK